MEVKREKDDILVDHDERSPTRETSLVNSPMTKLVKEDEKSLEKINVNNSTNAGKEPQIGFNILANILNKDRI